jgi:predicted tellurium resistance membrane protein TerC
MFDLRVFASAEGWVSLFSLAAMEVVLGIDNIIFITILTARLQPAEQPRGRSLGLILALFSRLGLLFAISWMMRLTSPLVTLLGREISGRDAILIVGGTFLVGKAAHEIHYKLEGEVDAPESAGPRHATLIPTLIQIMFLDIVFSLDSVITAVGMAPDVLVMMLAMVVAVGVMLVFAGPVGDFVEAHPTMKILALSFLLLIGVVLVAEGFGQHVSKGYVYFAMGFAVLVETINMRMRKARSRRAGLTGKSSA